VNAIRLWMLGLIGLAASGVANAAICPSPALLVAPDSRYELIEPVAGEVIVRDLETGLEWQQCPQGRSGPTCTGSPSQVDWSTALELAHDSTFGGHDDWRLPNAQEFYSLIEWGCNLPALNESRFPGELGGLLYWSSSSADNVPEWALVISTSRGDSGNPRPKDETWSVRLVRGGDAWSSFNAAAMPDPFAFTAQLDVPVAELRQSETITISGLNAPTQVHVIGDSEAAYSHNGGAFGSAPQLAANGDQIQVQHRAGAAPSTTVTTTLFVGGLSAEFRSTTIPGQRVGGSVSGLLGSGLVLQLNGIEDLPIAADGSFQFNSEFLPGDSYAVSVINEPSVPVQACSVDNASGQIPNADVNDILVTCETAQFSIGGSVSGLLGSGLLLQNNGADDLTIVGNGPFSFATPLDDLSAYNVTVAAQPQQPAQTCMVDVASGALAGEPVDTVLVSCSTDDVVVSPSSGPGGSITPDTAQTLPYQGTLSFTLSPEAGHQLYAVNGSCAGSLDGLVYTTAPVLANCTVQAEFRPLSSTAVIAPTAPVRAGESILYTVDVTGLTGTAPQDGSVSLSLSSGEACSDPGPPSINGDTARFSCAVIPVTLGDHQAQASFQGSSSHIDSVSSEVLLAVRRFADLSAEVDDGESESVPGAAAAYLLMIRNAGPDPAPASAVLLAADPPLQAAQWTCSAIGSASCPAPNGNGELSLLVDLPAGAGLDLLQTGEWPAQLPPSAVVQAQVSASGAAPDWVFDADAGDNSDSDVNHVEGVFADGFE
jgi:hypothetical protein